MTAQNVRAIMYAEGRRQALDLQARSPEMTGTELVAEENIVPLFDPAKDYTQWPKGAPVADEGQVWILIQPYNAAHYTGRPSSLRALWGLAHTTDKAKAKPWVAPYGISGLYMVDEVCTYPHAGSGKLHVWRCTVGNNEYPPQTQGAESRWVDMGLA